jgi:hypothetical protein
MHGWDGMDAMGWYAVIPDDDRSFMDFGCDLRGTGLVALAGYDDHDDEVESTYLMAYIGENGYRSPLFPFPWEGWREG